MEDSKIEMKRNKIIVFIAGASLLLFLAILILVMVSGAIRDIEVFKNANFVEVEATIVEYREYIVDSYPDYSTFYQYRSPKGGVYSGCWQARIKTEEEAKSQIGMKVPIYVDDELHLQTKSLEVDNTGIIVGCVFGSICLVVSLGLFSYSAIWFLHRKKTNQENRDSL